MHQETCAFGNGITESLRKETKTNTLTWSPTLKSSAKTDVDEKELEKKLFVMEHKAKLGVCLKRENAYEENLHGEFAEI